MKKTTMWMLAGFFALAATVPEAQAAKVVAPNSCKTYAIVSVYADTNRQTKIGEQVAWSGSSADISVSQCPKSIVVTSNKNYGDLQTFLYPTKCNTITITITDGSSACRSAMTEQ